MLLQGGDGARPVLEDTAMNATLEHRCERCGVAGPQVMYDRQLQEYLCNPCWLRTSVPGVEWPRQD